MLSGTQGAVMTAQTLKLPQSQFPEGAQYAGLCPPVWLTLIGASRLINGTFHRSSLAPSEQAQQRYCSPRRLYLD